MNFHSTPAIRIRLSFVICVFALLSIGMLVRSTWLQIIHDPKLENLALEMGCDFTVDTDAHAPGQLAWLPFGASRAAECGVPVGRIVNTRSAEEVLAWARGHEA